jgi:type IV fimbrial biogenesis protein FimT
MRTAHARGFTLVELMVVLTIVSILVLLAIPNFVDWMQNSKTRSVADSIQNGLRYAQEEAIRLSRMTTFTATASSWTVDYIPNAIASTMDTAPHPLQQSPAGGFQGTTIAAFGTTPAVLAFNSLGRVSGAATSTGPFAALSTDARFDVTNPKGSRRLRILDSPAGKVRMCDPDKTFNATTTPDGC